MTAMPLRHEGLVGVPLDNDGVTVGKVPVRGVGLRVGVMGAGTVMIMSPAKARRLAPKWRSPEAMSAGLDWIATAMEEAATEIDAMPRDEQIRLANATWATMQAKGAAQ